VRVDHFFAEMPQVIEPVLRPHRRNQRRKNPQESSQRVTNVPSNSSRRILDVFCAKQNPPTTISTIVPTLIDVNAI